MTLVVGSLPDGTRGLDANSRITPEAAAAFYEAGYRFAVRYVRRSTVHAFDLNSGEVLTLLNAGLGLMVVQHVAAENWVPTPRLGTVYGAIARDEAEQIGVPAGVSLWCDLEGVRPGVPAADVIGFCNNWHWAVADEGYHPGLYVGWHAGLNATQLYKNLRFDSYWSAYTNNNDTTVAVRGFQMYQHAAVGADLIPGFTNQNMDVDVIRADKLGGTPSLLLPSPPDGIVT